VASRIDGIALLIGADWQRFGKYAAGARTAGDHHTKGTMLTEKSPASENDGRKPFSTWIGVSLLIVVLDQMTKLAILKWVPLYDKIALTSFINITHQHNRGAAFSFLADASGWQRWFFTVLAVVVSIGIVVWLWRVRREKLLVLSSGLALVLGGAIGNVVDRIRFGYVVDFIQVLIAGWPFPSFNVADSAITVGAVLLIIDALFISGRVKPAAEGSAP
jgi:signal peptidase II